MKSKLMRTTVILLFAAGLLIFNYPVLSSLYNQIQQNKLMDAYDTKVGTMSEADKKKYLKEAAIYNKKLAEQRVQLSDAFSEEGEKKDARYDKVLAIDKSGVLGSIEIPRISLYLPIYHGTSSEVLERGIGHLEGTSFPVGGENTHAVLTGHRGLPSAELFSNLDQIKKQDIFYIHILGETLAYKVFSVETVEPSQTDHLVVEKGQDLVTLVTCTPYGVNTHRLLIHGYRIPYKEPAKKNTVKENLWKWIWKQKTFLVSILIVLLAVLFEMAQLVKKRRKKA
ncbi:MAG: class C sortase [Eubacterium sp.]|nr:class C sortase [Eubacterium sp.]MDD7209010.1 class C sortase [Lachnospiraceae bacterium]MDY5497249.1 class C sortase [Anaerobutyricum sp.]